MDAQEEMNKRFKHMIHTVDDDIMHNKHTGGPLDAKNAWGKPVSETTKILGKVKTQ
jgi:hypothetical protein